MNDDKVQALITRVEVAMGDLLTILNSRRAVTLSKFDQELLIYDSIDALETCLDSIWQSHDETSVSCRFCGHVQHSTTTETHMSDCRMARTD